MTIPEPHILMHGVFSHDYYAMLKVVHPREPELRARTGSARPVRVATGPSGELTRVSHGSSHHAVAACFACGQRMERLPSWQTKTAQPPTASKNVLTARERSFVEHYLLAANGAKAAEAAGYSATSAGVGPSDS
jgi:hypothetical protein